MVLIKLMSQWKFTFVLILLSIFIHPLSAWEQGDHIAFLYNGQEISGIVMGRNEKELSIILEKGLESVSLREDQVYPIKWNIGRRIECRTDDSYTEYYEGHIKKYELKKYYFGLLEQKEITLRMLDGKDKIFRPIQCRLGYINFKSLESINEDMQSTLALSQNDTIPTLSGNLIEDGFFLEDSKIKTHIIQLIQEHEKKTSDQIVVLVKSGFLYENSIEEYSLRVAEEWKLGQKDKDNGVLILIMPGLRKARIEVGYGLEGYLTDITCNRILNETMIPRFKESRWEEGILEGVHRIIQVLDRKEALQEATYWEIFWAFDGFEPGIQISYLSRLVLGFLISCVGLVWTVQLMFNLNVPLFPWFLIILFFIFIPAGFSGSVGIIYYLIIHFSCIPIRLSGRIFPKVKNFQDKWTASSSVKIIEYNHNIFRDSWDSRSTNINSGSGSFSGGGGSFGGGGASGSW